jgi:hypothetical protein
MKNRNFLHHCTGERKWNEVCKKRRIYGTRILKPGQKATNATNNYKALKKLNNRENINLEIYILYYYHYTVIKIYVILSTNYFETLLFGSSKGYKISWKWTQ